VLIGLSQEDLDFLFIVTHVQSDNRVVQKGAYEKIGPTAELVAHVRALIDMPYAKDIALASRAERDVHTLAGTSAESMSQFAFLWEARYKATNRIIAQREVKQVLEIAAGLSPRALTVTESSEVCT
jgi:hypothetical protein